MATTFELHPIGRVRSPISSREQAPKQGDEGAPEAWLEIDAAVAEAARHLRVGEEVILLTWLDRADRSVLSVHPEGGHRGACSVARARFSAAAQVRCVRFSSRPPRRTTACQRVEPSASRLGA
jgi:tRNA (Thr-GGU) A37 N-methylase